MPQSLAKVYLHLVFSTKHRTPFLQDQDLRSEVHAYLSGICRDVDAPALRIGGVEDHVHLLCYMSRTLTIADLVQVLKKESSKWLKTKGEHLATFHWQVGYGAFSASPSHVDALCEYIAGQEAHHRGETFQDEYRRLLTKYDVEYDERYVWD